MPIFKSSSKIPKTPRRGKRKADVGRGLGDGLGAADRLAGFIGQMQYPAGKRELVNKAAEAGLETVLIDMLEQLPEASYNSPADVSQALGENSGEVT